MKSIIEFLGYPDDNDLSYVSDAMALKYLKKFKKISPTDFSERFPQISTLGLDCMAQMLTFNPYLRANSTDLLQHPYFAEMHKAPKSVYDLPQCQINCAFETGQEMSMEVIKHEFKKIIFSYRYKRQTGISELSNSSCMGGRSPISARSNASSNGRPGEKNSNYNNSREL